MSWIVCPIVVMRPFGTLFVEHAMRVHAVRLCAIMSEHDSDGVPHLRTEDGTKQAKVLPFWRAILQGCENVIGIRAIDRLSVDLANAILSVLSPKLRNMIERHAAHLVDTERRIVPVHFVCGDVVISDLAAVRSRQS
jgi:hypothetical protein